MKKLPFALIFLLGFFLVFGLFSRPARAVILQEENAEILGGGGPGFDDKAFNLNQFGGTIDSLNYFLSGQSEAHPELIALGNHGAIGDVGVLISKLYTPPVSSIQYFAYLKQNLGLASPAYAQGTGFTGLTYLLPVWKAFRNAAYLIFILLFIIIGLMIMFRMKISPQAVISIQTALPRLVVALILITLSYAIAGLLIDLMYVVIYLFLALIGQAVPIGGMDQFQSANVFEYWTSGANLGFESIRQPAGGISTIVERMTGDIFILTGLLKLTAGGVAMAIFTIAILWALFRLFFILVKAYVWIIVMTIFSPLQFMLFALPGGGGTLGFGGWLRGMAANLAVFPLTVGMFALASALFQLAKAPGAENAWVAPLIGGSSVAAVQALIALGIILMTPSVAQMANDAFKAPAFPYGAAMGTALGAGPAMIGGVARRAREAMSYEQYDAGGGRLGVRRKWRSGGGII